MSKSTKSKRQSRREITDRSSTTDIVSQFECALRYPRAAAIGALIGGLVPWFARTMAHVEVPEAWNSGNRALLVVMIAVVIGCTCFSGLTVYKFGKAAFGDPRKALGFVLALEGVLLVSHGATSALALLTLIVINAVSNGSVIAMARETTCRQRAALAKSAATRARNQAAAKEAARPARNTEVPAAQSVPVVIDDILPAKRPGWSGSALGRMPWLPARCTTIEGEVVSGERLLA